MWDLLIRRGRILDPHSGHDAVGDLAVHQGRIGMIGQDAAEHRAAEEIDAAGMLVTPGLVDIHTHLWAGGGYWGLEPEAIAWRTGVTSWVDAGSAGAYTLRGLRDSVAGSPLSISALLNISAVGIPGETGEHRDLASLDVELAHTVGASCGDFVRGVKARIDSRTVGQHGTEPLRRARQLADLLGRPMMVHIGYGPPTVADVEPYLRPGDILTHCASGSPTDLVTASGISSALRRIADRGVHLDIGHGSGAFAFDVLEAERAAGLTPTISTDLHALSVQGPAFDMPTVMEKMMAAGWSLPEAFSAATAHPASVLGLDAGSLEPGARADIAIFDVQAEEHPVIDVHGASRTAPVSLRNVMTIAGGRPLPAVAPQPPPPWVSMTSRQRQVVEDQRGEIARTSAPRLRSPHDFREPYPRSTPIAEERTHDHD